MLSGGELHRPGSFRADTAVPWGEKHACMPPDPRGWPLTTMWPLDPRGPSARSSILIKLSSEGRREMLSLSMEGLTSRSSGDGIHGCGGLVTTYVMRTL